MAESWLSTRSIRFRFRQQGAGEPVLFIHGFPETSYEWRHQLDHFAGDYACFAPDLRGFGGTDKPGARVSRALLASDIIDFMDAAGIGKANVVAHDWGGIVAFKLAVDYPERVSRLALLDTLCTVWSPAAVHGYWFKVEGLAETLFANSHDAFIESTFTGRSEPGLPGRPASPWQAGRGANAWASAQDVETYRRAFADPDAHRHAISYYRYALPFHIVHPDPSLAGGERYESLSEARVAAMWLHDGGLESHPDYGHFMDYGPEDRHKTFEGPTLWMFGSYLGKPRTGAPTDLARVPTGNPFVEQFPRYFPDLRVRRVAGGHFFPEEIPDETNAILRSFLSGGL